MRIYSIYKLTNTVNNKTYIGFTSLKPTKRFKLHFSNAKMCYGQSAIHSAIRKYGKEAFKMDVIYESYLKDYALSYLEPMFIKHYKQQGEAQYNISLGGEGSPGRVQSKSERAMRSVIMKEISSRKDVIEKKRMATINKWLNGDYRGNVKSWEVTHPNGDVEVMENLKEKCGTRTIYAHTFASIRDNKEIKRGPFKGCIIKRPH